VPDAGGGERAGRERAAAGLSIARDRADQEADDRAGRAVGERAVPRHALAVAEEARAEHVVRAPARNRFEHPFEVGRVVLGIAVDVDRCGISLVARELKTRAQGGAESPRLRG
jgi:hypothetical protein